MSDLAKFLLKAYARKGLTVLGTFLLTHGLLIDKDTDSFVAEFLEPAVGAVLIGASAAWEHAYQWYVKRKVLKAKQMPPDTTSAQLEKALEKDAA